MAETATIRRRSIKWRTLTLLALLLAATFAVLTFLQVQSANDGREHLVRTRGELLAGIQAQALVMPLWNLDDPQVNGLLRNLADDPDFGGATLFNVAGEQTHSHGELNLPASERITISAPITRGEDSLGHLELHLSRGGLDAAARSDLLQSVASNAVLLAIVLATVYAALMMVLRPLSALQNAMKRLADADLTAEVSGTDRGDEIGDMARAVQIFKVNAEQKLELEAQQTQFEAEAEAKRKASLAEMADRFETEVKGELDHASRTAVDMTSSAVLMADSAGNNSHLASAAAQTAERVTGNVQTVASAVEELAASIREISRQVATSSDVAS
ncbi:MAG TPA: HAMP domain-containing protein, partial [Arenibaculum sp.]|nr:HAMP domain-containing protein [Arenibaculum sp.]